MEYFDSHAHYNDGRFAEEYPGRADAAIRDAYDLGIRYILNAGTNPETSRESIILAEKYPFMYAAVGLHPEDAMHIPDSDIPRVLDDIRSLAAHHKVVAIGEIGLDYHWDPDGRDRQIRLFDAQLSMAEELSLPVIVHDRDAHGDAFDTVRAHPNVRGVFHSFSGSAEMARQLSMMGWYISFSGTISYKNAAKVREAAAAVPHDRLLIETDAPYLAPVPHRGKINYSGYVADTARALADAIGLSEEETVRLTTENAKNLFGIQ